MTKFLKYLFLLILIPLLGGAMLACGKHGDEPLTQDPAYRAKLVFKENFSGDLKNWFAAGRGETEIRPDGTLFMKLGTGSTDLVLWSKHDFAGNFQVEYKITFGDSTGSHIVYFCARGKNGENIPDLPPAPIETFEQYIENTLASYQVSMHSYDETGRHQSNSRMRKNPNNLLLASAGIDPCKDNRDYVIDVFKIDNRIQFFVDGALIHDLRDRGGFGPTYVSGKIGFAIHGRAGAFSAVIDDIRVFKLAPK